MADESTPVPCPDCGGIGRIAEHVSGERPDGSRFGEWRRVECILCAGFGTVAPSLAALRLRIIAEGERRRAGREARGLSLREEARRPGIPPRDLSDIEDGRIPDGG